MIYKKNFSTGACRMLLFPALAILVASALPLAAQVTTKTFAIHPNPAVESCMAASPTVTPMVTIEVTMVRPTT